TIAVVERLSPNPTAPTSVSSDSVSPTVATACAPSRLTQNTSTTANSDSSTTSSTMGMASSKMARFKLPVVKSWCEPRTASWIELHSEGCAAFTNTSIDCISRKDIRTCTFRTHTAKMRQRRAQRLVERNEERKGPQQVRLSEQQ